MGYKLLQKSGWKSGEGVNKGGIVDPVMPKNVNRSGKGLGRVVKKKKKPKEEKKVLAEKKKEGRKKKGLSDRMVRNMLRTDIDDEDEMLYNTFT